MEKRGHETATLGLGPAHISGCRSTRRRLLNRSTHACAVVAIVLLVLASAASPAEPVTCDGQPATIVGTPRNDTLVGTSGPDVIVGFGGNDKIYGMGGDDIICPDQPDGAVPEAGNDHVDAGPGSDVIMPSSGKDFLDGGGSPEGGFDAIEGGPGNNQIVDSGEGDADIDSGEGADTITVNVAGNANLNGGGDDHVTVVAGHDANVDLGPGPNRLTATVGNDINADSEGPTVLNAEGFRRLSFNGSPGNDTVITHGANEEGDVSLNLGAGNDTFRGDPGSANGFVGIEGEAGDDTIIVPPASTLPQSSASGRTRGPRADASRPRPWLIRANLVSVDGGPGNDRIVGSPNRPNFLFGEEGNDSLAGGSEQDDLGGGEGNDSLNGGAASDWYEGGAGNDTIYARDGQKDAYFDCGEGHDTLTSDLILDQAVNRSGCAENRFAVDVGAQSFTSLLPATSVATYVWTPGDPVAHEWLTAAVPNRLTQRLNPQTDPPIGEPPNDTTPVIEVDPNTSFQSIEGFGGAMTQSAAYLLAREPAGTRKAMLNALFSSSGAHLNYVRVPMGATDLSTDAYDYDPLPAGQTSDFGLEDFTVAHDEADIIPALQQARAVNPEIDLMATPWSAPGWMKIGEHQIPDSCSESLPYLKPEAYPVYARYFLKFLQAYRTQGLPVSMISLQNEPHHCDTHYPTMRMEPGDQADLAKNLRPLLETNGFVSTGILGWDHNWSENNSATTYPEEAVESAQGTISAVGYHCYDHTPAGPEVQSQFHEAFPEVDVYFTECTGNYAYSDSSVNLVNEVRDDLIDPIDNWARTSLYWSLVLGTDSKPVLSTQGGCQDCRGMLAVDRESGTWSRSEDYYYWAQFSKFVQRGARRIQSTDNPDGTVKTTAFRNPDGSIVVVALNTSSG